MRTLVLVDGEHYPPVTRWALDVARERGHEVVGALFVGGIGEDRSQRAARAGSCRRGVGRDRAAALARTPIDAFAPEAVLDLSDEPVLGYRERMAARGRRPDSRAAVPGRGLPARSAVDRPAAAGAHARRHRNRQADREDRHQRGAGAAAARRGLDPVVVAMGRGGPAAPQVAEAGSVDLARLVELVRAGEHAASDYLEDALTTGVTHDRRAPGRPAGSPAPPMPRTCVRPRRWPWRATRASCPGRQRVGRAAHPLGCGRPGGAGRRSHRIPGRLSRPLPTVDVGPRGCYYGNGPAGSENLSALRPHLPRYLGDARYVVTDFIPVPLADVRDRRAFFATTAPAAAAAKQVEHLGAAHGCPSWGGAPGWPTGPGWRRISTRPRDTTSSSRS